MRIHLINMLGNLIIKLNVNSSWYFTRSVAWGWLQEALSLFSCKNYFHIPCPNYSEGHTQAPNKIILGVFADFYNAILHVFLITKSDFRMSKLYSEWRLNDSLSLFICVESWKWKYEAPENSLNCFLYFHLKRRTETYCIAVHLYFYTLWTPRG